MARALRLVSSQQGQRQEIGVLSKEQVFVGREPGPEGITLGSQAVSRKHGEFVAIRNHWFYRDLGSTNGSWLNAAKLAPEKWMLVKAGDRIQCADLMFEMDVAPTAGGFGSGGTQIGLRSLIVFSRGSFLDEYPIPEYGRALVIGGAKADLKLDVDMNELPALVFERRGDSVCAFSISRETPVSINGADLTHTVTLKDRDELRVDHYEVLYNDVNAAGTEEVQQIPSQGAPFSNQPGTHSVGAKPTLEYSSEGNPLESTEVFQRNNFEEGGRASWEEEDTGAMPTRVSERLPFGRVNESQEDQVQQTIAMDPSAIKNSIAGYDVHPAMRHSIMDQGEQPLSTLEDKIWIAIGFAMILALLVILGWWFFAR